MQIKHFVNGEWVEVRQNKLAEAFDHAAAHGSEFAKDLYKIATNNQGHVTQATPVTKTDLTNYGLLDTNAVAPVYSDDTTYSTGEFCIYQGKLYKALQDVDHEEFNPSKWEESNLLTATIGGGTVITGEADWNAQQGNLGYIKNKPDIPEGLPSVSAEDDGKTLVVDDGNWTVGSGGGGGTGGGITIATYSSEDGINYTCDMTLAQIFNVFNSGGFVVAKNEWTGNYEYPTYVNEADANISFYLSTMEYKNDTSVTVSFEQINHTGDGISGRDGYGSITGYIPG